MREVISGEMESWRETRPLAAVTIPGMNTGLRA